MIVCLSLFRAGGNKSAGSQQRKIQLRHRLQRQRLGARLCGDTDWPSWGKFFGSVSGSTEVIVQCLPLLCEAQFQKSVETGSIDTELKKSWGKVQPKHRGIHIRR